MALLWIDGFENYGVTVGSAPQPTDIMSQNYYVYFEVYIDIATGRDGGYAVSLPSSSTYFIRSGFNSDTLIVGAAFKITNHLSSGNIFYFQEANIAQGSYVNYTGDGELEVKTYTTQHGKTSGLGLTSGVWYYIELKVTCHQTTGSYELKVNNVTLLSGTNLDTQYTGTGTVNYTRVKFGPGAAYFVFDDVYICDDTGSVRNDFLGNCKVVTLRPTSDDTVTWTPDTGVTNYDRCNEVTQDDTSYVEATSGQDLYGYENLSTSSTILGIAVASDVTLTGVTSRQLNTVIESNVTTDTVTHNAIGIGYSSKSAVWEEDPDTSGNWTQTTVNAIVAGFAVT